VFASDELCREAQVKYRICFRTISCAYHEPISREVNPIGLFKDFPIISRNPHQYIQDESEDRDKGADPEVRKTLAVMDVDPNDGTGVGKAKSKTSNYC
jgi:hypothetical protein